MALKKITGKDIKEAVDWLLKEKQGCVHQVLGRTDEGTELCLVIGWADIGYDLEEVKKNGYEDEGYYICSKIGYQHRNNGMQSDFEWDFPMPYNPETGDVWDTDTYVAKGDEQSWQTDADMYNKEAEKIWATWGVPNEDGQTTLDIMESKKKEAKKHTSSMQKKKESLAKKNEAFTLPRDVADAMKLVKSFLEKNKDAIADEQLVSDADAAVEYQLELTLNVLSDLVANAPKSESKKNEAYSDFPLSDEDVKLVVNYVDVDEHGGSFSVDTPKDGQTYSLEDMKDMIKGMCDDCTGYADISRDGSDILIIVNAPEMDENGEWSGDYYDAMQVRCSVRVMSTSLESFVDYLDKYNEE